MKPFLSIFIIFLCISSHAQQIIFPDDFYAPDYLFKPMKLYEIRPDKPMKELGKNPGVTTDTTLIEKLIGKESSKNAKALFYQLYIDDNGRLAAVMAVAFKNRRSTNAVLRKMKPNLSIMILTKANYLIRIMDKSYRDEMMDELSVFYSKKLNARLKVDRLRNVQRTDVKELQYTTPVRSPETKPADSAKEESERITNPKN